MLENIMTLIYLIIFSGHNLENSKSVLRIQNKKIKSLMKSAYNIPFYRKKFEECGLLPRDFKCAEDLAKFPCLTKAELREFIKTRINDEPEKYKNYKEEYKDLILKSIEKEKQNHE